MDAVLFTMRHSFVETRMFVSVEHGPDLVVFLERIFFPLAAPVESQRLCEFDGLFCNGVGNAHVRDYFHNDLGVSVGAPELAEIGRLCIFTFAKQDKEPLRFTQFDTTPQIALGGLSSRRQELNQEP